MQRSSMRFRLRAIEIRGSSLGRRSSMRFRLRAIEIGVVVNAALVDALLPWSYRCPEVVVVAAPAWLVDACWHGSYRCPEVVVVAAPAWLVDAVSPVRVWLFQA